MKQSQADDRPAYLVGELSLAGDISVSGTEQFLLIGSDMGAVAESSLIHRCFFPGVGGV